ncbi:MAG: AAA family ATPase [Bacteroidales bacterium]
MNEKIIIENFGGINKFEVHLNQINVFIGPQATGKSICAKLFYFFKRFQNELIDGIENQITIEETEAQIIKKFEDFFPPHTYPKGKFSIRYIISNEFIEIRKNNGNKIELKYSNFYKSEFQEFKSIYIKKLKEEQTKEQLEMHRSLFLIRTKFINEIQKHIGMPSGYNQIYIPAVRSFFANIQKNIFSFLSSQRVIDPFFIEFGSFYESMKRRHFFREGKIDNTKINDLVEKIICGKYIQEKGEDFLIHPDGRKVNISYSSSGQQETLPLTIILKNLLNIGFLGNGATVYIEEPEAHLFPFAQKSIVELIASVFNFSKENKFQFIVTTHSPYILTSFNNLIHAGSLQTKLSPTKKAKLYKIVPKEEIITPGLINAYSLEHEGITDLICKETGLIATNIIDSVSDNIAIQFDELLNLE